MTEDESSAATVAGLSVPQKASLCLGSDYWHTAGVSEFGIEPVMLSDGPHGLRKQPQPGDAVGVYGSVPATCWPTASALASSWDPGLAREVGAALGLEARAQGVAVVLGPGVNLKRSPLCGRNFEYLSEDPFLAGRMAAAIVGGLQSQDVGGCVNHLAGNNQETDRMRVSADVDERTLREIYLPAFEHVVTAARPWLVMCAYNKVNGTYASQHRWLLTEVLRGEWGFDGLAVSDWGAVHDRVAALIAGLDLEMPPNLGVSDRAIADAVAAGDLAEEVLDQAAGRVIGLVRRARRRGRDHAPRACPPRRGAEHGAAEERRRAAAGRRARPDGRRDRRARPHPRVPGGRCPGEPDPRRCPAAGTDHSAAVGNGPVRRRVHARRRRHAIASGTDGGGGAGGRRGRRRRCVPWPAAGRGVRGLRPYLHRPPGRADRPAGRPGPRGPGHPAGGGAVQRRRGRDHLGPPRLGGAGVLAGRAGHRRRGCRCADGPGQPLRAARRDDPRAAGGLPVLPQLSRRGRPCPVRRGGVRGLPRLRRRRPAGGLPVRPRPDLHQLLLPRPADRPGGLGRRR